MLFDKEMSKSKKNDFSYNLSPKRVDTVCNLNRAVKSTKDCDVGESLVSGYKRSCPYKRLVAAYCRKDPRLGHMIDRIAKTLKENGVKGLMNLWAGATTYIEMLYLMYLFYKGKVQGWTGNNFKGFFSEDQGKSEAKLCRYGILTIETFEDDCSIGTDKTKNNLFYQENNSSITFICPRTCSETLSTKLVKDNRVTMSMYRYNGVNHSVEHVDSTGLCYFNPPKPIDKLDEIFNETSNMSKEDMINKGYFSQADCEAKITFRIDDEYSSAKEMIEKISKFSPNLLNIVDGFDVYVVGVKEPCSSVSAAEVVLSVMKDSNFIKVF